MRVYEKVQFRIGYDYYYDSSTSDATPPETVTIRNLMDTVSITEYNYYEYVGIESIDEDTYFYVKALNGFESGNFDEQELTGAVKMRRNVHGGSGNISLIARTVVKVAVYDHYKPKWILQDNYIIGDDDVYYNY
jgi:hypothetical protein